MWTLILTLCSRQLTRFHSFRRHIAVLLMLFNWEFLLKKHQWTRKGISWSSILAPVQSPGVIVLLMIHSTEFLNKHQWKGISVTAVHGFWFLCQSKVSVSLEDLQIAPSMEESYIFIRQLAAHLGQGVLQGNRNAISFELSLEVSSISCHQKP